MTDDPIASAARAAAARLAAEYGPGLPADVEAALQTPEPDARPGQYADPVAIAGLIVAIATLAWSIYSDLRKTSEKPAPDAVARRVRAKIREQTDATGRVTERITDIVVTEITQTAREN